MAGWQPPGNSRERILTYGGPGSWKTTAIFEIAKKIDGTVYTIDTDDSHSMILERMYPEIDNVDVGLANGEWPGTVAAIERAEKLASRDDWVAYDSTSDMWDQVIDHFSGIICGKDLPEFLTSFVARVGQTEAKKTGVQGAMIEMGLYDYVNPTWRKEIVRRTKASKHHIYMTAQAGEAGKNPREDALTKQLYGQFGYKPRTQKELGFNAATVLLLGKNKLGTKGNYSVVKDWGRSTKELQRDVDYDSFAGDFLFKVAGWRPGRPT